MSSEKIDLSTFMLSIASAAYIGLGLTEEKGEVNLELARQNINLLELIQEKTRGNRTPDEDRLVEQLLFETRMRFCDIQKSHLKNHPGSV